MDVTAAKYIGAGLAMLGMIGAGIGLGILFGNYLNGALRNPSAAPGARHLRSGHRLPDPVREGLSLRRRGKASCLS
jgi:hypothetical protein